MKTVPYIDFVTSYSKDLISFKNKVGEMLMGLSVMLESNLNNVSRSEIQPRILTPPQQIHLTNVWEATFSNHYIKSVNIAVSR